MRFFSTDPHDPGVIGVGQEACGIFALGQSAHGIVAIGQLSRGVFCVGQLAIGVFAIGQGAIGLWHATGMVALAGQRGYGLVFHTLPRVATEPQPDLPRTIPLAELASGAVGEGWISGRIVTHDGAPAIAPDGGDALIEVSAIYPRLLEATHKGFESACVKVRATVVHGQSAGYRSADARLELVAEDVVPYLERPPTYLTFSVPPKGAPGKGRASAIGVVVRGLVWIGALVLWWVVVGWPLMAAFFDLAPPW